MKTLTLIPAVLLLTALPALAKTNVSQAVQQLKTNEENAKANYKQYNDNADVASKNIVEVTNAVKVLRDQRQSLQSNGANMDKNKAILDAMKAKLIQFKTDEQALMKKEDVQLAQVQALLQKLEANKKQREQNLAAYDTKIQEVDTEKANWGKQQEAYASIQKELNTKEAAAMKEREKWIEKKKEYRGEAGKWQKETQLAEQNRVKIERLGE